MNIGLKKIFFVNCFLCLFMVDFAPAAQEPSPADPLEEILAGHSYHGQAFNEGARQQAYLMGGTGNVSFPVTTENKDVQALFDQGVGQLHGFWDLEAERSFRQVASIEPECAMAYWGAALATFENKERARGFIEKAVELKDNADEREKLYIESLQRLLSEKDSEKSRSLRYIKDLEDIAISFPEDLEAKALIVHRIWYNARNDLAVNSYLAAEALLKEIFAVNPLHPAHHYRIHLWDRRKPELALESAAMCGLSAPKIAHMWHMPGHIYSRLKRYEDAVFLQEASARVDHQHMIRDRVMPDEIHNFSHNNEWLIRNFSFLGRVGRGLDLAKNMMGLPRHPKYNTLDGDEMGSAKYGRKRLLQLLREFHLFEETIALYRQGYFEADSDKDNVDGFRLVGCSSAALNETQLAKKMTKKLRKILNAAKQDVRVKSVDEAELRSLLDQSDEQPPKPASLLALRETKSRKEFKECLDESSKSHADAKRLVADARKAILAIEGYAAFAESDFELAAEKLSEANGEDVSFIGELEFLAGDTEEGIAKVTKQVDRRKNESIPLARLSFMHYQNGDLASAKSTFELLRDATQSADLDIELFSRLQPVANAAGLGKSSWLKKPNDAKDIGFRPPLESLGPFRWSPPSAPKWEVYDSNNELASSESYAGKNYLLIFYLGHGCLHCAEQLGAFGPRVEDFEEAGIEMIAISSDNNAGLSKSLDNYDGEMPIRLASNSSLEIFKSFRAHDDFENQPLHGTFLIDGQGRIRWQDISFEPFMEHEFLLCESKRLLKISGDASTAEDSSDQEAPIRVSKK